MYEWQGVGLIVLAGVDLSPPDGAAMQMSTCPLCSLLAPARDGVPRKELEFSLKQAVHMQWKGPFKRSLSEYEIEKELKAHSLLLPRIKIKHLQIYLAFSSGHALSKPLYGKGHSRLVGN